MTIREFTEVYDEWFEGEKINHKANSYNNYSYDYDYYSVIENYLDEKVIKIYHRDYDNMLVVVF